MLRFFRIGFLFKNELDFDKRLTGSEAFCALGALDAGWRGPYNQVTSHSLDQFNVSGLTVLKLNWFFAQVRQEAFSSLERSP
jgi:hypothetical protein